MRGVLILSLWALVCLGQNNCITSDICESNQYIPSCEYLSTNADSLCLIIPISHNSADGVNCSVNNCVYSSVASDSGLVFCCDNPTSSATVSASIRPTFAETTSPRVSSSILPSPSSSRSSLPTTTCLYHNYNAANDFSSVQGSNGWYYGYYNGGVFTQFTSYGISPTGSVGSVNSWNYNTNSNGIISANMLMQNGAVSCNTPTYGNIAPVLRWYNPSGSCYQDVTISFALSGNANSAGSIISLTVNGASVYSYSGVPNVNTAFNAYGVRSVELSIGPLSSNCDWGQTTYTLAINPMGASSTVLASKSNSASSVRSPSYVSSRSVSASPMVSRSSTVDESLSGSARASTSGARSSSVSSSGLSTKSSSGSASLSRSVSTSPNSTYSSSATSTVFFLGNWTDLGRIDYAQADILVNPLTSLTIYQCQLNCWLNPLCGVIAVESPCNTVSLNDPQVNTLICPRCWLKYTSGWNIASSTTIKSLMFYDRVYPPTTSSLVTRSQTASAVGTPSLTTVFNYNMCGSSGGSVFLPIVGSYVDIVTNALGTTYTNNLNCVFTVGGGSLTTSDGATQFLLSFTAFNTEGCCDSLGVYNGATSLVSYAGSVIPNSVLIPYTNSIRLTFGSDPSVTFTGVNLRVTLVDGPTPSLSATVSSSPLASRSSSFSSTNTKSVSPTASLSFSASNTRSASLSGRSSDSISLSGSPRASFTSSADTYKRPTWTSNYSAVSTQSFTLTGSPSASAQISSSGGFSRCDSKSGSLSNSSCSTHSVGSFSSLTSLSSSGSPSGSSSITYSPSVSSSISSSALPSVSSSPLNTWSRYFSMSASVSYSSSSIRSSSPTSSTSLSLNRTFSGTATYSSSMSMSKTSSASYYWRPKLAVAPGIPANLASLSVDQISNAISDLGNYDPSVIKNNLQVLGAAALFKMDTPLVIATDTFSLTMAKLSNSSEPLAVGPLAITVPSLNISGAAASSVIKWSSNPYPNSSTDSSVVSMNIINRAGGAVSVRNLSTPIRMDWQLTIDPADPRFQPPPQYIARCDTGIVYQGIGNSYTELYRTGAVAMKKWLVPCLMGTKAWINCSSGDVIKNFACPVPTIINRCLYWSSQIGDWSDEGCVAIGGANGSMTCLCDHMTDFSARVDAVLSKNEAIFANAENVYSLEGLIRYVQWYAIFGGIGLVTIFLGMFVIRVDQVAVKRYIKELCHNEVIAEMLAYSNNMPIYIYDAFSTVKEVEKWKDKRGPPRLNIILRILVQHSRLGFLFRFDPRLSRLFRLLGIFLMQFHSLFITALLYGFTYGAGGKKDMAWYDNILLAIITTALNMPVVKILISSMNNVGLEEFKVMFPVLFAEYTRRIEFEKLGLAYLAKKRGLLLEELEDDSSDGSPSKKSTSTSSGGFNDADGKGESEDSILDMIWLYFCCRSKNNEGEGEDYTDVTVQHMLRRMAIVVKESYPYIEAYNNFWSMFPCHTNIGLLYLLCSFGWIAWCLNYLLLFAAAHDKSVGESVMISYATSEITTVFLTQPLIIGLTYIFYKLLVVYKDRIPVWLRERLMPSTVRKIPAVYYFSDPWVGVAKTAFTSEYAYNLFVKCPANASGVAELVYANQKAITYGEMPKDRKVIVELKALYKKLVTTWDDIRNNRP